MTREEAIKVLRTESVDLGGNAFSVCRFLEALDIAIKELEYVPDKDVGKWISVKDRMPEQEECVLLLCKTQYGASYKCIGFYESGTMRRDDSDYCWDYEVCDIYDEENDDYLVNKGWFERVFNWDDYSACGIEDTVTHWMPLPEPPEEGTDR